MNTELNPAWLRPEDYVEFLSKGFAQRWNRAAFDWYAARRFNGVDSDLVLRADGQRILAGVSLCYRQVTMREGRPPLDVCVASAGTTLPEERRRGHYRELLHAALQRCRERNCAALLGFVTRDNGSGRGLRRIGARAIPSYYITSTRRTPPVGRRRRLGSSEASVGRGAGAALAELAARRRGDRGAPHDTTARFHYAAAEDWRNQFVLRPNPVRVVRLAHDSVALLETVDLTDRLQWLSGPEHRRAGHIASLAAASSAAGRKFFMYSLDLREAAAATRAGLKVMGGYLMLQPVHPSDARWDELAQADWRVQSGDRL